MERKQYVSNNLLEFVNETKKSRVDEGCNCGGKQRPSKPTVSSQNINTKNGSNVKLNEGIEERRQKSASYVERIKNHKFSQILESNLSDNSKKILMVNEGYSENSADVILQNYKEMKTYIRESKINEDFDMLNKNMDEIECDFMDRRNGKIEAGLYDSAPDNDEEEIAPEGIPAEEPVDELGLEGGLEDTDELGLEGGDDTELDGLDDTDELDHVSDKIQISKFVFGVDNVDSAIAELQELGIDAQEFNEEPESTDELGLECGDESTDELGLEDDSEQLMEGEIVVDVANWTDTEYENFTGWLEKYGVNPEDILGGDDLSIEDEEAPEDLADETTSEEDFGDETATDDTDFSGDDVDETAPVGEEIDDDLSL